MSDFATGQFLPNVMAAQVIGKGGRAKFLFYCVWRLTVPAHAVSATLFNLESPTDRVV